MFIYITPITACEYSCGILPTPTCRPSCRGTRLPAPDAGIGADPSPRLRASLRSREGTGWLWRRLWSRLRGGR